MDSSIKDSFYEKMIPFKVKFNKQKILFKSYFISYLHFKIVCRVSGDILIQKIFFFFSRGYDIN